MQREKRKEKIINYIEKLYPNKLNTGEKINLEGFSMFFGDLAGNNPMLSDVAKDCENHKFHSLQDIKNQTETSKKTIHLADGMDQYYTPNLFAGTKEKTHRNEKSVMWLNSLYVDIDGIKGVYDYREGLYKLYKACEKAGIPYPDIVLNTSINPTVHLQALWLIDPVYIKDKFNRKKNEKNIEWWRSANSSLSYVLGQADSDLEIDSAVTTDIARYMRLPYTYNQKTGEMVQVIDDRITDNRHLLEDMWVKKIINQYFTRNYNYDYKNKKNYCDVDQIEILEHPQVKAILQGVPKYYRYNTTYGLIKMFEVSNYTKKETINAMLEWNKKCKPAERESKVVKTVERTYKDGKGIDIKKIAEMATISLGEGEFEPDPALLRLFNIMKGTLKRKEKIYNNNKGLVDKITFAIRGLVIAGNKYLPNIKELAERLSVNYQSLKKYFSAIKANLQRYNLYINYDYSQKKYVVLSYAELIQFAFERKETRDCYANFYQKVIHKSACKIDYIVLCGSCAYSCRSYELHNYKTILHKRGSPKLE